MDNQARDEISLCFCSTGGLSLAFSSAHLTAFVGPDTQLSGPTLDLAERLGLSTDTRLPHQAAVLSFQGVERVVRLGHTVRLGTVPIRQLYPLPALVRTLRHRAGLAGIVFDGTSVVALLIDFESLQ